MKKFLLLVAIATLSSVAYGQMTEVLRGGDIIMVGWDTYVCDQYVIKISGTTLTYYNADDFSVAHTLTISDMDQVRNALCLPRGAYANNTKDYSVIFCNTVNDFGDENYEMRIYNLDDNVLVESIDGMDIYPTTEDLLFKRGSNIYLRVENLDGSGLVLYKFSGTISSNVSQPQADKNGLAAYPNPSHDKITLAYQTTTTATSIRICDVNGRLIERIPVNGNSGEYTLNVSNYPEGVYFYEINGKSSSFMVK